MADRRISIPVFRCSFNSKCGFYGRDDDDWACEARRYYFNIVGKFGVQVQAVLKKAAALDIRTIRPLHGPLLEDGLDRLRRGAGAWRAERR